MLRADYAASDTEGFQMFEQNLQLLFSTSEAVWQLALGTVPEVMSRLDKQRSWMLTNWERPSCE
jgi:hypothetical protein